MASAAAADGKSKSGRSKKADKKAEKDNAVAALHEPERCARCGAIMIETHCKVTCINCGFMRDCNDQW